jgi:hypothetical protein
MLVRWKIRLLKTVGAMLVSVGVLLFIFQSWASSKGAVLEIPVGNRYDLIPPAAMFASSLVIHGLGMTIFIFAKRHQRL